MVRKNTPQWALLPRSSLSVLTAIVPRPACLHRQTDSGTGRTGRRREEAGRLRGWGGGRPVGAAPGRREALAGNGCCHLRPARPGPARPGPSTARELESHEPLSFGGGRQVLFLAARPSIRRRCGSGWVLWIPCPAARELLFGAGKLQKAASPGCGAERRSGEWGAERRG